MSQIAARIGQRQGRALAVVVVNAVLVIAALADDVAVQIRLGRVAGDGVSEPSYSRMMF